METTLGGDRLGSGNKQNLSFRNYERSSHDLGYVWRSSMASGTLVPFLSKVGLPGDNWYIDLNTEVLTLPTLGPLFGSYKVQLDVFQVPIRLYNAKLHMNRLGIGMDMKSILLPQIEVAVQNKWVDNTIPTFGDNEQINASCLLRYLGIAGVGRYYADNITNPITRNFNAVPVLAYWDIYKNYYSNKQEEVGYHIHTTEAVFNETQKPTSAFVFKYSNGNILPILAPAAEDVNTWDDVIIHYSTQALEPDPKRIMVTLDTTDVPLSGLFESFEWTQGDLVCRNLLATHDGKNMMVKDLPSPPKEYPTYFFSLVKFPLENIDLMRDKILQWSGAAAYKITDTELMPYSSPLQGVVWNGKNYSCTFSQESLGIKTYQSDLFNNWINTEWIDGDNGISALTAVDTSSGEFTIDALNIASKVYDMLNRIAVSGGSYDDWLEAVYTHERVRGVESPVYCGSLIKELAFEEVVSLAETTNKAGQKSPLGTLAGRGRLTGKHKGGKIEIKVDEPSYIMGIVSITPRVDYSQGNEWDVDLKTMDDFHKPALDGIGFQDLITEQMAYSESWIDNSGVVNKQSVGKQPAWINYMTSVNKTYGSFAEPENSMFMTLNRRYEKHPNGEIGDKTSYIDPTKFNQIFAETALSSQNFWVQIACNITARRKMSAKIIPNL